MDFGQDFSLDVNDLDAVLTGEWGINWLDPALGSGVAGPPTDNSASSSNTPTIDESINLGTAAYNRSAWRWNPTQGPINQDHALASVLVDSHGPDKLPRPRQQFMTQPLSQQVCWACVSDCFTADYPESRSNRCLAACRL